MSKDRALLGLKRKDKETGLHYNRYRYYEPYSARYISKDPIGLDGGLNNSAYVSDPSQWVDPMGLDRRPFSKPKSSPHCQAILKKIEGHIKELYDKRYPDLSQNALGLPERIGPGEKLSQTVRGHRVLINIHDKELRKWQKRYDDECFDDDDKCDTGCATVGQTQSSTVKNVAKAGVGAGVLYVGYRVVRMIPSLFPALWPTIPANLAVP